MLGIGLVVLFAALVLTPWAMRAAERLGAVDVPRDWRRMHRERIPRAGGLAIYAAILVGALLGAPLASRYTALLCGGGLMLAIGLADDILSLSPWVKLFFQVAVTLATLPPLGIEGGFFTVLSVFWVVALVNAHNFVDGMDGLLAGSAVAESMALVLLFILADEREGAFLALLLAAACLGFLRYNRHPAVVFAGDCGSQMLGFLLGMLSLELFRAEGEGAVGVLSSLFVFAYPLTDLSLSVLRRLARGRSPFAADRGHLHHRIFASGLSHPACVRLLWGLSAALSVLGVLLARRELWGAASVSALLTACRMMHLRRVVERVGNAGPKHVGD